MSASASSAAAASSSHKRPREDIVPGSLNAVIYQATRDWLESKGVATVPAAAAAASDLADEDSDVDDEPQFNCALPRKKQKQPETDSESDDDEPLSKRVKKAAESDDDEPLSKRVKKAAESDDDEPLSKRVKKAAESDSSSYSSSDLDSDSDSNSDPDSDSKSPSNARRCFTPHALFTVLSATGSLISYFVPMKCMNGRGHIRRELAAFKSGKSNYFYMGKKVDLASTTKQMRDSNYFGNFLHFIRSHSDLTVHASDRAYCTPERRVVFYASLVIG